MRIALFADVHANLPALETFERLTRSNVDGYICLGDVVNYGPWNDECVDLVCSLPNVIYLQGNHERLFLGEEPIEHEIPLVQAFLAVSRRRFTRMEKIRNLPKDHVLGPYSCTHNIDGNRRIYPDTPVTLDRSYVIGHTHHQFRKRSGSHELINCGSVGQNRGFIDVIQYATYVVERNEIALHSHPYRVELFINQLVALGYPEECVDYYRSKKRLSA